MTLFMDRHNAPGLTSRDAAEAHLKDLEIQDQKSTNQINTSYPFLCNDSV